MNTCPDCHGTGRIPLFSRIVDCECQRVTGDGPRREVGVQGEQRLGVPGPDGEESAVPAEMPASPTFPEAPIGCRLYRSTHSDEYVMDFTWTDDALGPCGAYIYVRKCDGKEDLTAWRLAAEAAWEKHRVDFQSPQVRPFPGWEVPGQPEAPIDCHWQMGEAHAWLYDDDGCLFRTPIRETSRRHVEALWVTEMRRPFPGWPSRTHEVPGETLEDICAAKALLAEQRGMLPDEVDEALNRYEEAKPKRQTRKTLTCDEAGQAHDRMWHGGWSYDEALSVWHGGCHDETCSDANARRLFAAGWWMHSDGCWMPPKTRTGTQIGEGRKTTQALNELAAAGQCAMAQPTDCPLCHKGIPHDPCRRGRKKLRDRVRRLARLPETEVSDRDIDAEIVAVCPSDSTPEWEDKVVLAVAARMRLLHRGTV